MGLEKTVLHLRSTFHAGGTENLIVRFFNTPSAHFRILLVLMKPGPLMGDLIPSANEVHHFYRESKLDLSVFQNLIRLVKLKKPQIVHTHQLIELIYASLLKLRFPRLAIVHHVHLYNPRSDYEYYLEKWLCQWLIDRLVVVSESLQIQLQQRGYPEGKMIVLPNIVQRTHALPQEDKERFLQRIHYRQGDQLIGMIGNFVPEKDQYTLGLAFKSVMDEFPAAKLIFIGKESERTAACRELFQEDDLKRRVFFTGQWSNASELIPLFQLSVFSSTQETFGMAAIESLLYEVPVIASDIPVMKELSAGGRYFELFKTGDALQLAGLIRKYLSGSPDSESIKKARVYAEQAFNAKSYVEKLGSLYLSTTTA